MHTRPISVLCLIALALTPFAPRVQAQTWITPGSGFWDDPANWNPGVPQANWSPNISNGTAVLTAGVTASAFITTVNTGGVLQVEGGTLSTYRLYLSGPPATPGTLEVISGNVDIDDIFVIGNNGSGRLDISGGRVSNWWIGYITLQGGTSEASVRGTGEWINWNGLHVGRFGDGRLEIDDAGSVTSPWIVLGETVSGSGTIDLNGGTLSATTLARGAGQGQVTFDGGTLRLLADDAEIFENFQAGDVTLGAGGGTIDTQAFNVATNTVIDGTGTLTKTGSGTLVLSGNNTFTGGVLISEGTLQIGNGGTSGSVASNITNNASLVFNRSDNITYSGQIGGTGSVTKQGNGTLSLGGFSDFSGGVNVQQGALRVTHNNALGTGTLTLGNGTTLSGNGPRTLANNISIEGDITIFPQGTTFTVNAFSLNGDVDLTGATRTITNPSLFNSFQFGMVSFGGVISNGGLTLQGPPANTAVFFRMNGGASNTYTGDTTLRTGVSLDLAKTGGATAIAGDLFIENDAVAIVRFAEQIADTSDVTVNGIGRLQVGITGGLTETINGLYGDGIVRLDTRDGGSRVRVGEGEFAGVIEQGAAGGVSLEKYGSGTLVLSGNNTFAGTTLVSGGTLQIGANGNTGSVATDITNNSSVVFKRSDVATYSGVISGTGSLTQFSNSGVLVLTGENTYTGGTTVTSGILQIGNGGTTGSIQGNVATNGALAFNRSDHVNFAGVISGAGFVIMDGSGTLELSGANTFNGSLVMNAGTVRAGLYGFGFNNTLGDADLWFNGGTLQLVLGPPIAGAGFGDLVSRDVIIDAGGGTVETSLTVTTEWNTTGNGTLTKTGSGTLVLEGSTQHTGGTVIANGVLQIGADSAGGPLEGDIVNNATLRFFRGDNLLYAGDVTGIGVVEKAGASTLTITGNLAHTGGTVVSEGTLQIGDQGLSGSVAGDITNHGTIAFARADAVTYAGVISGTGDVEKLGGGLLTLTGMHTYSGATDIYAGTLRLDGSLASNTVTVHQDAGIAGTGTLAGSLTIASGGAFLPGNSPGIFTINGDLALASGSTTVMELNGTTPGAGHDQIVVGGTATLGGTLQLYFGNTLRGGDTFTLIDAAAITGDFDSVVNVLNNALTFASEITDDYRILVTAVQSDYAPFATTPNQRAIADALDRNVLGGGLNNVVDALNALPGEQLPDAFNQLAPEELAAIPNLAFVNARNLRGMLGARGQELRSGRRYSLNRFTLWNESREFQQSLLAAVGDPVPGVQPYAPADAKSPDLGVFLAGEGTRADIDGDANAAGYDLKTGSALLGLDHRLAPGAAVGLYVGYQGSRADLAAGSEIDVNTARTGLYGQLWGEAGTWASANLGVAWHRYTTERAALGGTASGETHARELVGEVALGHDFKRGRWTLSPEAKAGYTRLRVDSFSETGSLAPLDVGTHTSDSLRGTLGFTATRQGQFQGWTLLPFATAAWNHEFLDTNETVRARFLGVPDEFQVSGADTARDSFSLGAGLNVLFTADLSAGLSYTTELSPDYQVHGVRGTVTLRF